ncbi:phage tail tape measure protein [Enterococcus cecorum]|uniref:Phage tail tape measure protein n=1 Tax=Enterococcus cecorum TaxID=44008 RepID=A0AAW8TX41_9ENTE|nr:phage tail tape measure protein [Enterococcus cecorum]MDT2797423.1 phage tail tape measure protein [Enterococcus cecorum]
MADRVKGITIEIDGNTQGLDKALKSVNDKSVKLNKELKDVNKLLKFDPGNAELVAQKQKLLSEQVENTKTKLNALKQAQSQVEQQFQKGEIDEGQYRNFQREIASTEQSLRSYESQLKNLESSQTALGQNTKRLETFFEASKTSVDDYADILGNKLTAAIKGGYANADQLEVAINKIGREFTEGKTDVSEFKRVLDSVDDGNSIDEIRNDLEQLRPSADEASESMDDLAESVTQGNMMQAGEIISGLGDKIVDLGGKAVEASLQYQQSLGILKANTTLSKQELEQLGGVAQNVFKSGVTDSIDEATQATALMKQSFGDLNNQQLTQLTGQVMTLSQRTGTDVNENVRAASKLMQAFGLDAQSAFDLVASGYQNGLNKSGDFTDTLNEYAPLFQEAGFSAQDMFEVLKNGTENGAMNTDKVADAVKELQIRLGDGSFEKVMGSFSQNTQDAFNKWKEGKATVKDVATSIQNDLKNMSPEQQQQALSQLSTQFEDLGTKAGSSLFDIKGGFDDVKGAMDSATESDPSQKWQSTWNEFAASMQQIGTDILTALQPVLDFVSKMIEAFGNLPTPIRIFIEVIAGLIGVFALLAPIIASIISIVSALAPVFSAIAGVVGTVAGVLSGPLVLGIAAAIGAVVGIIAVIMNWSTIWNWIQGVIAAFSAWFSATWQSISAWFSSVLSAISSTASSVWNGILSTIQSIVNGISNVISNVWNTIKSVTSSVWNGIKSAIEGTINAAKDAVSRGINAIKNLFNFKISWPHIPLPHFRVSGSANPLDWLKGKLPSIGIDWYAKGGILTRPTVFGMNGNNLMVGGEAGKEAVAPLSDLMDYVRQAVKEEVGSNTELFMQMISLLTVIANKDLDIYLNASKINEEIEKIQTRNENRWKEVRGV